MPFPRLSDTESWDRLIKARNRWPKEKPSLYARHIVVLIRLRRLPEAAALSAIVKEMILSISLRHLRDMGIDTNPVDIAETVTSELLLALFKPKSSGRKGLRTFFWTTVRRKTDSVAQRRIFKTHQFMQLDTAQAQDRPDAEAVAAIETGLLAEQARRNLKGAKGKAFDEALLPHTEQQELTASERYALTRRETAARSALQEILGLDRKPAARRKWRKTVVTAPPEPTPAPTMSPQDRRIAEALLLEDGKGELPPNWEDEVRRFFAAVEQIRVFQKCIHLYQPRPEIVDQEPFDDFDLKHGATKYDPFDDFHEWHEEDEEFEDWDEIFNAA